ncbi:MAG: MFS transporter, partial [Vampirovibrionia bacterium]
MIERFKSFFMAPPPAEEKVPEDQINSSYKHWSFRMFYSMFIAYSVFYICRKNISIALPCMNTDLGISYTELGILGSTLYITYAVGKFINGVLADRGNIRTFLSVGLLVTAIINIIFGSISSLWIFIFLWGLNGWVQSMGFPPVAKGLTHWFGQKERATKWSIWSTSHGVGTTLATWLSGIIVAYFSWRYVFILPGVLSLLTAIFLYNRLRDTPVSLGLPTIEEFKNEPIAEKTEETEQKETYFQTFCKHILPNKVLWGLAFAYFFVYIVRWGTGDWLFIYYKDYKHYSEVDSAFIFGLLFIAGIIGTVAAGFTSDKFFKSHRQPVNIISCIILGIAIWLLLFIKDNNMTLDIALIFVIGIFTYIPQVLVGGVCAVESGSKKVASAATGFTGMFGYFGSAIAGPIMGYLLDFYGWEATIYFWVVCSFIAGALCFVLLGNEIKRLASKKEEA